MQLLPNTAADCSGLWFSPTSQARSHSCLCPPIAYPFPPEASTQSGPELPGLEGEYSYPAKAPWAWGESLATHLPLLQRVLHHSLSPQQRHLPSLYSLPLFQNFSFSLWANCLADSQPLWKNDIMLMFFHWFTNWHYGDFHFSTVDKNLPANARDMGSNPDLGRYHMPWGNWAHVPQLLRLPSRACKPQLLMCDFCSVWGPALVFRSGARPANQTWPTTS